MPAIAVVEGVRVADEVGEGVGEGGEGGGLAGRVSGVRGVVRRGAAGRGAGGGSAGRVRGRPHSSPDSARAGAAADAAAPAAALRRPRHPTGVARSRGGWATWTGCGWCSYSTPGSRLVSRHGTRTPGVILHVHDRQDGSPMRFSPMARGPWRAGHFVMAAHAGLTRTCARGGPVLAL